MNETALDQSTRALPWTRSAFRYVYSVMGTPFGSHE